MASLVASSKAAGRTVWPPRGGNAVIDAPATAPNFSRLNGSMFVSKPTRRLLPFAARSSALAMALFAVVAAQPAFTQGTHLWTQSRVEDFEKGTPQGVAVTSDGHLREGPG